MFDFTDSEKDDLLSRGFKPGFIMDIEVGDMVSIPTISRFRPDEDLPVEGMIVRFVKSPQYSQIDLNGEIIAHEVFSFYMVGKDERPYYKAYGNTYPIMIRKMRR